MIEPWGLDGPFFDDLHVGQHLLPAPAITIDTGMAAMYQAICGDPYRLSLSAPFGQQVTRSTGHLVNPALALQVSIGQSTVATRRVIANLFYQHVVLRNPVWIDDTLTTTVEILAMRETSRKPNAKRRGMALLGMRTVNQHDEVIVNCQRCALLPWRSDDSTLAAQDAIAGPSGEPDLTHYVSFVPTHWNLDPLGDPVPWDVGRTRVDPLRDTVTDAPALVRLTQNLAAAHRDAGLGLRGKRLVYGGHTIGLAQASLMRLVPNAASVIGWHSCDHTGPVFEDDVLSTSATLTDELAVGSGRLLAFTVAVRAQREGTTEPLDVLEWRPVVFAP